MCQEGDKGYPAVSIFKASRIYEDRPVGGVTIHIHDEIPNTLGALGNTLDDIADYYRRQASALAEALVNSLPQGTCDRLIIELMARKVSLYMGVERPWKGQTTTQPFVFERDCTDGSEGDSTPEKGDERKKTYEEFEKGE